MTVKEDKMVALEISKKGTEIEEYIKSPKIYLHTS